MNGFPASAQQGVKILTDSEAIHTPWSSVGYLTAKRTYCRRKEDGGTEEWADVWDRVVEATDTQLNCGFTEDEKARIKNYGMSLKGSVAGRFLWQLGTSVIEKLGLPSLQNCAGVVVDSPVRPFTWTMDRLMLGCGVGFNIQREFVYEMPKVRTAFSHPTRQDDASAEFIVPDTREGWVKLLEYTLRAAFQPEDKPTFTYSTQLIRSKGAVIKGFGGVASGPEDLCWGINEISNVIYARRGKKLRPIDCLDIMNIIGEIVVAGNIRRSAQIALGDPDDLQFLRAKKWADGTIPRWRSNSNNSVVCNDFDKLPDEFWKTYKGGSEAYGLINLKLARSCGRTGDTRYKDRNVTIFNPCAEQPLENFETCCLGIGFLPMFETYNELKDWAFLLYRICKHSLALHDSASPETQAIVNKNMRMGLDLACGYLQATKAQQDWLPGLYEELRSFDKDYSAKHGWSESIKLTTCKPNGTLSLLPGVTPGVHPGYAHYMIRRIQIASDNPLVKVCKDHGYHVEYRRTFEGADDRSTVVVSFPFKYPENTAIADGFTAVDQLEIVRKLQTDWSDNAVSCTVYYSPEELPTVREYLTAHYNRGFKSISFMLRSDHGFDQAPFEKITKEDYNKLVRNTRTITNTKDTLDFDESMDCESGACPVR